jgi:hypothetical protein
MNPLRIVLKTYGPGADVEVSIRAPPNVGTNGSFLSNLETIGTSGRYSGLLLKATGSLSNVTGNSVEFVGGTLDIVDNGGLGGGEGFLCGDVGLDGCSTLAKSSGYTSSDPRSKHYDNVP